MIGKQIWLRNDNIIRLLCPDFDDDREPYYLTKDGWIPNRRYWNSNNRARGGKDFSSAREAIALLKSKYFVRPDKEFAGIVSPNKYYIVTGIR